MVNWDRINGTAGIDGALVGVGDRVLFRPDRETLRRKAEIEKLAQRGAPPDTGPRKSFQGYYRTPSEVTLGLGLNAIDKYSVEEKLAQMAGYGSVVSFRQDIAQLAQNTDMDEVARRLLQQRALDYYRSVNDTSKAARRQGQLLIKAGGAHKYISRKRKGDHWEYTYHDEGGDGQPHFAQAQKIADVFRKHDGAGIGARTVAANPRLMTAEDHLQEAARKIAERAKAKPNKRTGLFTDRASGLAAEAATHLLAAEHLSGGVNAATKEDSANDSRRQVQDFAEGMRDHGVHEAVADTMVAAMPAATAAMHRQFSDIHIDRMNILADRKDAKNVEMHADSRLKAASHLLAAQHLERQPSAAPTPPPAPPPVEKPKPPPAKTVTVAKPPDAQAATPRTRAKAAQKKADEGEYEFARESKFANRGEDLKNSARHKVNAWRGIDHAEADGTAERVVKRDTLLKLDPPDLMSKITDDNAVSVLAAYQSLKRFPPAPSVKLSKAEQAKSESDTIAWVYEIPDVRRPGGRTDYRSGRKLENPSKGWELKREMTKGEVLKEARADYVTAFGMMRAKAEELASSNLDAVQVVRAMQREASQAISKLRESNVHSDVANQLVSYANNVLGGGRASVAADLHVVFKTPSTPAQKAEAVRKVLDGASIPDALGHEKAEAPGRKKSFKINEAELYLGHAEREGPKVPGGTTFKGQEKALLDTAKIRGLQWGNSVTDKEREHHLRFVNDSFHDLTSVLGLPPALASFNGRLGLAIGARGIARAMAHYEPNTRIINLTRANGVGTLAHEWSHFFDNVLGELHGTGDKSHLTESVARSSQTPNTPVAQAVSDLMKSAPMRAFQDRMERDPTFRQLPSLGKQYWRSPTEMWARCFEKHVIHKLREKGQRNTYLSGVAPSPLWPSPEETEALAPLFDRVFEAFKESDMLHKAMALMFKSANTAPKPGTLKVPRQPNDGSVASLRAKELARRMKQARGEDDNEADETSKSLPSLLLRKSAAGEGSRGGQVIGHTQSGKPIYAASHSKYATARRAFADKGFSSGGDAGATAVIEKNKTWTEQDHEDAAQAHKQADTYGDKDRSSFVGMSHSLAASRMKHEKRSKEHYEAAQKQAHGEGRGGDDNYVHHLWMSSMAKKSLKGKRNMNGLILSKAGGEGSRGGKIIGHTRSNKPIYSGTSKHYEAMEDHRSPSGYSAPPGKLAAIAREANPGFTKQDHKDASAAHEESRKNAKTSSQAGTMNPKARHQAVAMAHEYAASMKTKKSQGEEGMNGLQKMDKSQGTTAGVGGDPLAFLGGVKTVDLSTNSGNGADIAGKNPGAPDTSGANITTPTGTPTPPTQVLSADDLATAYLASNGEGVGNALAPDGTYAAPPSSGYVNGALPLVDPAHLPVVVLSGMVKEGDGAANVVQRQPMAKSHMWHEDYTGQEIVPEGNISDLEGIMQKGGTLLTTSIACGACGAHRSAMLASCSNCGEGISMSKSYLESLSAVEPEPATQTPEGMVNAANGLNFADVG